MYPECEGLYRDNRRYENPEGRNDSHHIIAERGFVQKGTGKVRDHTEGVNTGIRYHSFPQDSDRAAGCSPAARVSM